MAKCKLSIEFSDTPENIIQQATEGITKAKGQFSGDTSSGSFKLPTPLGSILGRYTILGSVITLVVEDKPMFVSCGRIESELRNFIK